MGTSESQIADHALRSLIDEHRTPLLRYVRQLLPGDPHRAEDVVQETFLKAWFLLRAGAARSGSLRPWLFAVARNHVIDLGRRDRARPWEACDDTVLAELPAPLDLADAVSDTRLVADALAELPPPHREVLVHMHCLGRTGPEAARLLGIAPGTVKSRNYHAVRALRRILTERGAAQYR